MPNLNKKESIKPWVKKPKGKQSSWSYNPIYHTTRWRKLRLQQLAIDPLCFECKKINRTNPANVVDHIDPVQKGGNPFDLDNLQSLCTSHHNSKTGKSKNNIKPFV
tara:strand:- start:39 stop:356 length:318 start_codon:yes stop_codon:yes gene_type:complete